MRIKTHLLFYHIKSQIKTIKTMATHSKFTAKIDIGNEQHKDFLQKVSNSIKTIANSIKPTCRISNIEFVKMRNDLSLQADFFIGASKAPNLLQIHLDTEQSEITISLPLSSHIVTKMDKRDNTAHNFIQSLMDLEKEEWLKMSDSKCYLCY